ncbi:hypothetical protein V6N13_068985 [Hibiscus sabdariffa]
MGSLCLVLVLLHISWSLSSVPSPSPHLCLPDQKAALLQFKNSNFPSKSCWFKLDSDSWNNSIDCCSWQGVKCNKETGNVIGLDLSHSCVDADLSVINTLVHLHSLQWLDLSSNELFGSLLENTSSSLFRFHALRRLDLAYNEVDGAMSPELFSQLVSLTHLNLSSNWIDGLIPNQISLLSSLVSLDLSHNYYSLSFESQGFDMLARNLTRLRTLVLDSVDMSDVSLTSFLNLSSSLEHLSLGDCRLHGEFPTLLFRLPNLKHIDLSGNENLTGYLPNTSWSSGLELLNLSYCGFRGSIPASFGSLTRLVSVDLSGNWFEGQIPDVFGNLGKLTSLRFSSCNLSGPLPITLFNLAQITALDLSDNQLEGPLPNHVSKLQLLKELVLSSNAISGGVPSWLFTLPSLLVLDLGYNKLAGPMDRIQMPISVEHVDLSSNQFDGPIPDSVFDLVNLTSLHLSSNNLSGVVNSDMLSKLPSLEVLDLSNNSLLSLSTSGDDANHSFPRLTTVSFSSCNVRQFPSFFRTSSLVVLDLSNNMISGGISKWEAEGWEALSVLNLSYNSLTTLEQLPGGSLTILDLRSNMLEGPILSTCQNLQFPEWLTVFLIAKNKLTGNE